MCATTAARDCAPAAALPPARAPPPPGGGSLLLWPRLLLPPPPPRCRAALIADTYAASRACGCWRKECSVWGSPPSLSFINNRSLHNPGRLPRPGGEEGDDAPSHAYKASDFRSYIRNCGIVDCKQTTEAREPRRQQEWHGLPA